ncbi:hypothetical protein LR48_Vigan10g200300 [Vigna angularis]|uniref:Uncharacterized protein n=1 Tax=Phaseolus angularis TaxID=3914 RepID=A0A0L9VM23_PHAAN|nr:hypothetical protein LR48_Vigan10g200300 [Vigna angularis]
MKDECYPKLVSVFYKNIKVINGDIHSRVKGVDIIINNDTWLRVAGLKDEGCMSSLPNSLHNRWTKKRQMYKDCMRYPRRYKKEKGFLHRGLNKEEKMIAYILEWVLVPGRFHYDKLTSEDLYLLNAIQFRIPTNWVPVFKKHMIDIGINDCLNLPYGVRPWDVFSDEQTQTKDKDEVSDSDSEPISLSPKSEFEIFVINIFEKTSKKTSKMKKSIMHMEKKMDEIIKNYVDSSTSTEESIDEDDVSNEENLMEMSKSE